jgi:hypothetical protein
MFSRSRLSSVTSATLKHVTLLTLAPLQTPRRHRRDIVRMSRLVPNAFNGLAFRAFSIYTGSYPAAMK